MIRPIQYLRAIAALMVVWHHSLGQVPGVSQQIVLPAFGQSGVDLFFVISGFIMVLTTINRKVRPWEFMELRIVRVVPLYWLATGLMIGCAVIAPSAFKTLKYSPAAIVKSLLFVPYDSLSFPGSPWPVLVPGWTLNYEMFFYALFALSLFLPRYRLQALLALLLTLVCAGYVFGRPGPLSTVYTGPMLLEFGAGMCIAYLWRSGKMFHHLGLSIVAIVVGFALLTQIDSRPALLAGATMIVYGSLHPRLVAINSELALELGNASYSIYLSHLFTLGVLRVIWTRLMPPTTFGLAITFMAVALIACAVAGYVAYRWIEKPLTNWLRNRLRPLPTGLAPKANLPGGAPSTVTSGSK